MRESWKDSYQNKIENYSWKSQQFKLIPISGCCMFAHRIWRHGIMLHLGWEKSPSDLSGYISWFEKNQLLAIYTSIIRFMGWYNWSVMISWSALNITWLSQWPAAIRCVGFLNIALNKRFRLPFKISSIGKKEWKECNCNISKHSWGYMSQQIAVDFQICTTLFPLSALVFKSEDVL